jgi:hypothetical protein
MLRHRIADTVVVRHRGRLSSAEQVPTASEGLRWRASERTVHEP